LLSSSGFNSFVFAWAGTGVGHLLSGCLGIAGAGFAIGGRPRTASWLMAVGALGYLVSSALYTLLTIVLVPMPELRDNPRYPNEVSEYVLYLFPAPLPLLLGAVLASFSRRVEVSVGE
jgi:hypothetical protein